MILRGYFSSEVLQTSTNIQFIVPEKKDNPWRVVYLLHGLHGNQATWLDYTMLPYYSREYDALFVMPEVGRSFYCDQKYGKKYFTFVSEELPKMTQKIFNVSAKREDTAAMGCSMGGFGALKLALSRPDEIGFCAPIAPACIYTKPILDELRIKERADNYRKNDPEGEDILMDLYCIYGEDLEYKEEEDISHLAFNFPSGKPRPKIYLTCGTEDSLLKESRKFRDDMKNSAFDFTYEEWTGGHEWNFFSEALKKSLELWYKAQQG